MRHIYRLNYLREKKLNFANEVTTASHADENKPLLSDASGAVYTDPDLVSHETSLKEEHFSIEKLRLVDTDGTPHGLVEVVKRGFVEKTRVVLEFLLVLAQFAIHTFVWAKLNNQNPEFPTRASVVGTLLWGWLLVVVTLRLLNINERVQWIRHYPGNLWTVSFVSYMFLFASQVLPFRSVYIGHITDEIQRKFTLSQFYLDLALFMLLFTAKIGNDHSVLYKTNPNIKPSPEPVTSIMSFISWSWIDKFVWEAHLHSVKLKDIWGLMLEDYSIFVLKKFKAFTRNTNGRFSYNLIRFFSKYLLLQGFWACLDSVINFIPTLLLKRILEYVDDQSTAPANLAWFYVCSMFACRVLVAICQSQALFFGRRVCIRMKAIIISEIYTKALRRKTSPNKSKSPTDEVDPQTLNEQKDIDACLLYTSRCV